MDTNTDLKQPLQPLIAKQKFIMEKGLLVPWASVFKLPTVMEILFPFLCPADVLSLMFAYPPSCFLFPKRKYDFSVFVRRALYAVGFLPDVVNIIMKGCLRGDFGLTGSVLLMAIYDTVYKDVSDVDLVGQRDGYVLDENISRYLSYDTPSSCYDALYDATRDRPAYSNDFLSYTREQYVALKNGNYITLQYLYMQPAIRKNMVEFVKHFDFSFCRNVYWKGKLTIHDPKSVATRSNDTRYNLVQHVFPDGITCIQYLYHKFLPAKYARFCRYHKRGFQCRYRVSTQDSKQVPTMNINADDWDTQVNEYGDDFTKGFVNGAVAGIWELFWRERLDRQTGELALNKVPLWKI